MHIKLVQLEELGIYFHISDTAGFNILYSFVDISKIEVINCTDLKRP